MYKLELHLRVLPESLNKSLRAHHHARRKENKAFDHLIWAEVQGKKPKEPLELAAICLIRHSYRMLDFDGLVGSMKPVVDALVTAGVLADDSWNVTGPWLVDQKFRKKKDGPMLSIFVQEI
jgi:hypothetical protein